ncbi:unnamed protein product [Lactuca saligna]|uniref:Syntaxin 6/10/61 N-terminal domain-containing protein n=1 Tax=Lactuca saligna TaxID=75948 RepID=A0AA35ZWH7_LACSI|nr:unnamed protein product [Lactuca saligna]
MEATVAPKKKDATPVTLGMEDNNDEWGSFTSLWRRRRSPLHSTIPTFTLYASQGFFFRNFDAFGNLSSNDGSQTDQVGMNSEVASVIMEFTEPFRQDDDYENEEEEAEHMNTVNTHPVLLVAAIDNSEGLPPTIRRCFNHETKMGGLTEDQRVEMLSQSLHLISELVPDTCTEDVVKDMFGQTFGFMPRDIRALVADASSSLIPIMAVALRSWVTAKNSWSKLWSGQRKGMHRLWGIPRCVANVKWEDVGELEDVKKSILDTVQLPFLHKDLFSYGLRNASGVLLYDPPGTGKGSFHEWERISGEQSWLRKELLSNCESIEWQVDELEKTIFVATRDPSLYGIKQLELEKRRKCTTTAPIQEKIIEDLGSEMESTSNHLDFVQLCGSNPSEGVFVGLLLSMSLTTVV